jgi:hypothetical protein
LLRARTGAREKADIQARDNRLNYSGDRAEPQSGNQLFTI